MAERAHDDVHTKIAADFREAKRLLERAEDCYGGRRFDPHQALGYLKDLDKLVGDLREEVFKIRADDG